MSEQRLRFSKTGTAIYMSHLDLMRTFQRAFMRAGIKVKHSEGYNPHAYVSVALPLSVGVASRCELLDFGLRDESIPLEKLPDMLNAVLPQGILIQSAYDGGVKVGKLKYLSCLTVLTYDSGIPEGCLEALTDLFGASELVIEKKSKKGMGMTDIRPGIERVELSLDGDNLIMQSLLSAQNPSVSPDNLVAAIAQKRPEFAPDFAFSERIETYDENKAVFR